jgi:hypothetical protein
MFPFTESLVNRDKDAAKNTKSDLSYVLRAHYRRLFGAIYNESFEPSLHLYRRVFGALYKRVI